MVLKEFTQQSILILGAGYFGLASAYHLASNGFRDVTMLEKDEAVPSRFSAANDLNKVIGAEYADPFYRGLSLKAIQTWRTDPLYQPYYHEAGSLNVTSNAAPQKVKDVVERYISSIENHHAFATQVSHVNGEAEIKKLDQSFSGAIADWSGYFNQMARYAHSADAFKSVYDACVKIGVKIHKRKDVVYYTDMAILALSADVLNFVPQIGRQVTGRCWGVVHIQLTPEEAATLEGTPVTNLKFCHMGGGYTTFALSKDGLSPPFSKLEDSQFVPMEDEVFVLGFLSGVLPRFADCHFIDSHLCWFAGTSDSDYVIDYVPNTGSSLEILSGHSGHGFKMLSIFGQFVKGLFERKTRTKRKWQQKRSS